MSTRFSHILAVSLVLVLLMLTCGSAGAENPALQQAAVDHKVMLMHNTTTDQRFAAAEYAAGAGLEVAGAGAAGGLVGAPLAPVPGGIPDYFGPYSNYANSQFPADDGLGNVTPGTGIRKFVDSLPGLTPAGQNNLGKYIPVATSDTVSYPGSDYYEIALVQYSEKMHSDINPTVLRGYVQLETTNLTTGTHFPLTYPNGSPIRNASGFQVYARDKPRYLGPAIVTRKDVPVRVKFHNYLPTGTDGNLFIPVDTTIMGAGMGPDGVNLYKENRATIHLHGGRTPWISDGTPHQWTTPAGENTPYPEGVSVKNVPDMDGGNEPQGTLTFYYTNQQTARLMFYHDHAYGLTRLNVYAGEAAPYLVGDAAEDGLIAGTFPGGGVIPGPADMIPLVIQDKGFVPSAAQMNVQDPTWNWGNTSTAWPHTGDLYYPHVYMPLQNPSDPNNVNAMGRWDYGPWFWPPFTGFLNQPLANPYYDPVNAPWEPKFMPATPNPSQTPESFMDTSVVNGAAYPYVQLGSKAYRFQILNACNDRTLNLQFYYAASNDPMWSGTTLLNGSAGEINIAPAIPGQPGQPADWPTDGRDGGVPWANQSGPAWIQIGNEGGFLPAPAILPSRPVDYDLQHNYGGVLNIKNHSLLLMPAQRADVIVDFSGIPNGAKLILYNDAPAPAPGGDSRYDYYTGNPNQTLIGGAPTTFAGYGPNTRTIMQIQINSALGSAPAFNLNALNTSLPAAYATYQDKPIVPESVYNTAFGAAYPDQYVNLLNTSATFVPAGQASPATISIQPKAIIGDFEMQYGRLTALLGIEIPRTPTNIESRVPYGYIDPPTEVLTNSLAATPIGSLSDGTQIWRITNVDVDMHPLHWHMFDVQVLNRVIWDGTILPPEPNEVGWKETLTTPPLTDTIVALRPIKPDLPWELPNSIRMLDVTSGATQRAAAEQFTNLDPTGGQAPVINHLVNFGWEYAYHCHILGHEENDFMRPMAVAVTPQIPPSGLTAGFIGPNSTPRVNLTWIDNTVSETNWTVQRSLSPAGPWTDLAMTESTTGPQTGGAGSYSDPTVSLNTTYYYRVLASNLVGDFTPYSWTTGYPYVIVNSTPSANVTPTLSTLSIADFTGTPTSGTAPLTVAFTDTSSGSPTSWAWNFGDGNTTDSTVRNPVHLYRTPGTYTVVLNINGPGGSSTLTKVNYIVVSPAPITAPVAAFTGTPTSGTAPRTVTFTDSSANAPTVWQWTFGDGSSVNASVRNPVHTYLAPGTYTVSLTASNAGGANTTTRTNYIIISAAPITPPVAAFTGTPTSGIAPRTVTFTDSSTNAPTVWQWTFGDGSSMNASARNPVHTYLAPGTYTVSLTASNAGGANTTTRTNYIVVSAAPITPPVAAFSGTPRSGQAPLGVTFTDSSTNNPTVWQWNFGDGTTSGAQSLVHQYLAPGTYTVSLTASNAGGANTTTKTNYIVVSAAPITPPVAAFSGTPTSGQAPLTVKFTDSSTNAPTVWQWTFGDGSSVNASARNPVHTYLAPGTYTVSLTASNAGGANTTTRTNYIVVSAAPVTPPVAAFSGTPTSGQAPLTVTFTDSSTNAPTVWQWTFGDGSSVNASDQNPVHTYLAPGTYTVSLTASNAGGANTMTRTNYIVVSAAPVTPPVAAFSGTPTSGPAPLGVTFTDSSTNNPTVWQWNFGDGATSGAQNPVHTYLVPGTYTVSLTASNAGGADTMTRTNYITVTGGTATKIGIFRNSTHLFYLDFNGNGVWNGAVTDRVYNFGISGDLPITGDWNSDGRTEIGIFRPSTHLFYLDYNGNGAWNGAIIDRTYNFGITGDIPVSGDWNADGRTEIGIFRPSTHLFYLDFNGNGAWNGAVIDRTYNFGITGDIPVSGDWNADGRTEIGVFRPATHLYYRDYNGNGVWDGAVTDRVSTFGITGDIPVSGDWNTDGITEIGVFRPSTHIFYEDFNGNGLWNGAVTDRAFNFGITGDSPVTGKWS